MLQHPFNLSQDQNGAVTVFVVLMFTFLIAFGGLVFDISRIYNLFSESQSYVDQVSLAAAAELDGSSGAVQRSIRAAMGDDVRGALLNPGFRMTLSNDQVVNVQKLTFLSSITTDPTPGTRSPVEGDTVICTYEEETLDCGDLTPAQADAQARYVLVDTTTETEKFFLFPLAAWLVPDIRKQASVKPQAMAGFTREICNYPPMFICNPNETTPGSSFSPTIGQQIKLQGSDNKGQATWGPGDFGFLAVSSDAGGTSCSGSGANLLRCVMAVLDPNTHCISANVSIDPGNKNSVDDGFNVRFDMYDGFFNNKNGNAAFRPSANVTKGKIHQGNSCGKLQNPPAGSMTVPLPKDSCFTSGTCTRLGNGITTASLQDYWTTNHGGTLPNGLTTRYDVYRYEIDHNMIPNKSSTGGENGNPICSTNTGVTAAANDRRILTVAVVNCKENNIHGSQPPSVPVVAFAAVFLTQPIGLDGSSDHNVWAEVLGVSTPGTNNIVLHEFPVLYR